MLTRVAAGLRWCADAANGVAGFCRFWLSILGDDLPDQRRAPDAPSPDDDPGFTGAAQLTDEARDMLASRPAYDPETHETTPPLIGSPAERAARRGRSG